MQNPNAFEELRKRDPRYSIEAYQFVMDSLTYTVRQLEQRRHVTGQELLFGMRDLAIDCWGLMARHVLESWGVQSTDDVGEIVFNLVNSGLLSKTDKDTKDDFKGVFSFRDTFDKAPPPKLDEQGCIRRKILFIRPQDQTTWIPLVGDAGPN